MDYLGFRQIRIRGSIQRFIVQDLNASQIIIGKYTAYIAKRFLFRQWETQVDL